MLGKKSRPVIGILTGSLVSGNKTALLDVTTSPRSQTQSSKGPKNFDFGGVGLGIVAALEMSCDGQSDVSVLFSRKLSRSNPISVTSSKKIPFRNKKSLDEVKRESLEVYTIVTRHVPNKSYTEVYSNGKRGHNSSPFRIQSKRASIFHISPVRCGETTGVPGSDFLSSCHLCQKKLHGEDIYMYRGEKAFCSIECRYRQIVMDEHKDKCSSKAVDVSTSPYANEHIFTTGILAI